MYTANYCQLKGLLSGRGQLVDLRSYDNHEDTKMALFNAKGMSKTKCLNTTTQHNIGTRLLQ